MLPYTSETTLFIVPKNRHCSVEAEFWSWVYLHGKLEDDEGFDLVKLLGCNPEWVKGGIYPVVVNGHKSKKCRLYYWTDGKPVNQSDSTHSWVAPLYHGAIVDESDSEGIAYAETCYNKRTSVF